MIGITLLILTLIISIYLGTNHRNLIRSLLTVDTNATPYGVYSTLNEMIFTHFWHLLRAAFFGGDRSKLIYDIKHKFLVHLNKPSDDVDSYMDRVLLTHSCRTIFYCIIKTLIASKQERGDTNPFRICCCSLHFGSFYRLLRAIELAEKIKIEFYEIDVNLEDWTLQQDTVRESEMRQCDLILCQNLFGVPLDQDVLWEMGRKLDIPILEDCVQSGSLFSSYKGHKLSDVVIWSGGLDKTPSCFGGGFGYFNNTKHGNALCQSVTQVHNALEIALCKSRFLWLCNQTIHLIITKNSFWFNDIVGTVLYYKYYQPGMVKWYDVALRFRTAKAIAPFQHKSSIFLSQPSMAQLYSMRYGISKNYEEHSAREISAREFFLSKIPKQYHAMLFPYWTDKALSTMRENKGVGEFVWVYSKDNNRIELNEFLMHKIVTLVNTTWMYNTESKLKPNNGQFICENLTYLPNLNECSDKQIIKCAEALTLWCQSQKY